MRPLKYQIAPPPPPGALGVTATLIDLKEGKERRVLAEPTICSNFLVSCDDGYEQFIYVKCEYIYIY